eukprot:5192905-Prymnesium_polylepis.1
MSVGSCSWSTCNASTPTTALLSCSLLTVICVVRAGRAVRSSLGFLYSRGPSRNLDAHVTYGPLQTRGQDERTEEACESPGPVR